MKKLFRFIVFAAVVAGVAYVVKTLLAPSERDLGFRQWRIAFTAGSVVG